MATYSINKISYGGNVYKLSPPQCTYITYGDEITPSDLATMIVDNEVICTYDVGSMLINAPYINESDESIKTAHVVGALNNSSGYFNIPFSTTPKSNGVLNVSIEFHNYSDEASVTLDYTIGRTQSITQTVFGTSVTFSYNGSSRIQINVTATGCYWSFESNIAYETQLTGHSWKFGTTINDNDTLYYYEFKVSISSSSDQYVTWSIETKELGSGDAKNIWYATCSTSATTQAKIATTNSNDFILETGNMVRVKFTYAQTYNGAATLNVDGTGAKSIAVVGSTTTNRYYWTAGEVVDFVYDGTNFVMSNKGTATTTYYGLTKLSSSTSSTSTSLAATPSAVKAAYDLADSKSDFSGSYNDLTNKPTIPSVAALLDVFYPVGTIYETTADPDTFDPNIAWGGEWERIEGRFLVGKGTSTTNTTASDRLVIGANDTTGGYTAPQNSKHSHGAGTLSTSEKDLSHTHSLSSHTHTPKNSNLSFVGNTSDSAVNILVAATSGATHKVDGPGTAYSFSHNATTSGPSSNTSGAMSTNSKHTHTISGSTAEVSAISAGNLPPWYAVYIWKRIA